MTIAGFRFAYATAAAALLVTLGGCAGFGSYGPGGAPPGPATEQARLRLTDQCMYEAAKTANMIKDKTTPRCQCYARGALKQMSAGEIASVAAGGSVPFTVRSQEIMSACAGQSNSFADAPPRHRARKKKSDTPPAADAPASDAPAGDAPAPPPNGPTGGGDQPKSQ